MSRRQQAVATLLLASLMTLALGVVPAKAAETTMTFTGAVDVAGWLSSLTVQPRTVTISAGREVAFVNGTAVPLTVTVGGESTRLEAGGSRTMLFTGADRAETFTASATAVNLAVVGALTLTSSAGQVTVLAVSAEPKSPAPPANSASTAQPQFAGSAVPGSTRRPDSDGRRDSRAPAATDATPGSGAVTPLASGGPPATGPNGSQSGGVPSGSSGSSGPSPDDLGPGPSGGAVSKQSDASRVGRAEDADGADARTAPVLPRFPGFSSAHDQFGLVILLSAVVLLGLGTMAFRTLLAYRPLVAVGAHSQAARKARVLRRQRS